LSIRDSRSRATNARIPRQRSQKRGTLIWLSGADVETLDHTPRETRKFIGLGGIVLTTATLAAVSAVFALTLGARAPIWAAIPAGILWGLAIMNLDRWLVTAAQRRKLWYQNVIAALPRLLMALVIGAVISTPLVLWLFQREVDAQLNVIHQRKLDQHQLALQQDARFRTIPELQQRIAQNQAIADGTATGAETDPTVAELQKQYDELDKKFQEAQASATCEFDGTCGTKTRGGGEAYRQKLAVANELKRQRDEVGARLQQARATAATKQQQSASAEQASAAEQVRRDKADLDRLEALKKSEEDQFKADISNDRGLLARLEALSELTNRNATLKTAYVLLMLFITIVEVLPVAVKLLMNLAPPSTYDKILEKAEETDVAAAESRLERMRKRVEFESQTREAREEQLIRDRVDRMTTLETDEDVVTDNARPPLTTRLVTWLLRRDPGDTGGGYTPWPDEEVRQYSSINLKKQEHDGTSDDNRMTQRWSWERQ
jgi:hypothetical protein